MTEWDEKKREINEKDKVQVSDDDDDDNYNNTTTNNSNNNNMMLYNIRGQWYWFFMYVILWRMICDLWNDDHDRDHDYNDDVVNNTTIYEARLTTRAPDNV